MRKLIESNTFELITILMFLMLFKVMLLCYNVLGVYDFNNYMR